MPSSIDELLTLLDLEPIDDCLFRGRQPETVAAAGVRRPGGRPGPGRRGAHRRTPTGWCTRCTRTSCGPATPGSRSCTTSSAPATAGRSAPGGSSPASTAGRSSTCRRRSSSRRTGWTTRTRCRRSRRRRTAPSWATCWPGSPRRPRDAWDREWAALDVRYAGDSRPGAALARRRAPGAGPGLARAAGPLGRRPGLHAAVLAYASRPHAALGQRGAARHVHRRPPAAAGLAGPRDVVPPAAAGRRVAALRPGLAVRLRRPRVRAPAGSSPWTGGWSPPPSRRVSSGSVADRCRRHRDLGPPARVGPRQPAPGTFQQRRRRGRVGQRLQELARRRSAAARLGPSLVTVAVRGIRSSRPISPKYVPGPIVGSVVVDARLAARAHGHLAVEQHVERVRLVALADDGRPGGHVDSWRPGPAARAPGGAPRRRCRAAAASATRGSSAAVTATFASSIRRSQRPGRAGTGRVRQARPTRGWRPARARDDVWRDECAQRDRRQHQGEVRAEHPGQHVARQRPLQRGDREHVDDQRAGAAHRLDRERRGRALTTRNSRVGRQ